MVKQIEIKTILNSLLDALIEHLKGRVFKLALKKLIGSSTGIQAWIIQFTVKNLWNEIVEPLINIGLIEIKYINHKIEGNITAEKITKARKSGSVQDYNDAVDSAFD